MRRKMLFLLLATCTTAFCASSVSAENNVEILFRDIPWGTSYTDVAQLMPEFDWYTMSFEGMRTYPVNEIITDLDDYSVDLANDNINMTAQPFSQKETDVAGYTTTDIELFFAYTPVNNELSREESDTALYGARYEFEPQDLQSMTDDLTEKLSSLYGNPVDTKKGTNYLGLSETLIYWEGTNNTQVVIRSVDASGDDSGLFYDELWISYVWNKGNELLKIADDVVSENNSNAESEIYGNGSTNGL